MSDTKDLVRVAELLHFCADFRADLAADIRVNFVKDEDGDAVLSGEGGFEGEHDAGDFSAGGDGAKRAFGLAGIRRKKKFGRLAAERSGFVERIERNREVGLCKAEVGEVALDQRCELGGGSPACVRELLCGGVHRRRGAGDFLVKTGLVFLAMPKPCQACGGLFAECDDFLDRRSVFAFEGLDDIQTGLDF